MSPRLTIVAAGSMLSPLIFPRGESVLFGKPETRLAILIVRRDLSSRAAAGN